MIKKITIQSVEKNIRNDIKSNVPILVTEIQYSNILSLHRRKIFFRTDNDGNRFIKISSYKYVNEISRLL